MLQFKVLGPLQIKHNGRELPAPRGPKVRQLLSLLVLQPGSVVSHGPLVDELWGKEPPKTALSTVRTHIYHLRRILKQEIGSGLPTELIDTWPAGYVLRARPEQVDAEIFHRLARQGEALMNTGDLPEGTRVLSRALDLWSGDVLTDVGCGPVLTQHVQHLQEVYMRVLQRRIGADMQLGQHGQLAAELKSLVTRHPLNEWLHGQLITALYRCGRRGDALRAYQELRGILQEELGLDPSPTLQKMQRLILAGADIDNPGSPAAHTASTPRLLPRISRLPHAS
ncbi:BTAD domain-containing putative transcriptional regulator [Streptomyces sp. NPDC001678]|uniref:AfsR/SARP family transcriptional regulator n=1 Tax=Streptomyces sp. NPDC001678 TaxID=3364599 RepID=UPI0036CBB76C